MPDDDQVTQDPTPQPAPAPDDKNSTPSQPQAQPEVRRALPVDPSSQYDDALQQGMKLRQQQMQADEQYLKESRNAHMKAMQILSEPMPKMPSFEEAYPQPSTPKPQEDPSHRQKAILGFMAVAIPLALALGAGRRGSALGALAGLSQGVQAINEGYDDKAKQAAALWKERNDAAAKYGKEQMSYYKDIISNRKTNIEEKMKLINHSAEMLKDEVMVRKSEVDDWNGVIKMLGDREKLYRDHLKDRQNNEEKIMRHLGSGAEYEDYKQHLMMKSPEFRKAVESGDSERYFNEYNKATDKYTWKQFLDEREQMKVKEAKDRKAAQAELSPEGESSSPQDDKALDSFTDDLAKKLRGGQ